MEVKPLEDLRVRGWSCSHSSIKVAAVGIVHLLAVEELRVAVHVIDRRP